MAQAETARATGQAHQPTIVTESNLPDGTGLSPPRRDIDAVAGLLGAMADATPEANSAVVTSLLDQAVSEWDHIQRTPLARKAVLTDPARAALDEIDQGPMTLTMAEIPLAAIPCSQCGHLVGRPDGDASAVCSCGTTVYDIKAIRAAKDQVTGTTIEALLDDLDNLDRP